MVPRDAAGPDRTLELILNVLIVCAGRIILGDKALGLSTKDWFDQLHGVINLSVAVSVMKSRPHRSHKPGFPPNK